MSSIRFIEFRVVTLNNGAIEVKLYNDELRHYFVDMEYGKGNEYILHMAWRELWKSDAKPMLRKLCDRLGVDAVKKAFNDNCLIEEVARG